ncbi:MAG: FAD-dependent oxidoreductase [Pseudomonadota bacterium]
MSRDPRYDILFEPVSIGPVVAKNRFYQVPHCTGSGWARPRTLASMRETKAAGGWAVVNTEYCSVHPSCDDSPYPTASLWDDGDIRSHALMTEKVHAHGALAGVELCIGGARMANLGTREIALGVSSIPNLAGNPMQSRAMDKSDISEVRRWHRNAALRAKKADFDLVYIYATHGYLLSQFMSPVHNSRTDEYGGSLENRIRLVREIIEDTKEAIGESMAVAVRFSSETNSGSEGEDGHPMPGETEDIFGMIGELPDLWDVTVNDYSLEMGLSRFVPEGALEPYVAGIKSMTSKPVVTVGRFTSPDTMASQIKRGIVDFIGAARPSIADPYLPTKIEEGRLEDIRECIGCNICYMGDGKGVPIGCTQNPTMSEEWRRGWHPEIIPAKGSESRVLVVGAGPAGLEASHALGKRGYEVMLAEASRELGGRVTREARLPGLSAWIRVRDYRLQQLEKLLNVEVYRESELTAEDVLAVGADHVVIATGATWRADGFGPSNPGGVEGIPSVETILTPDDIMADRLPSGPTVIFDDDHYYMGTVLAELLSAQGVPVTLVTPADAISEWGEFTTDRWRAQTKLMEMGVDLVVAHNLTAFDGGKVTLSCQYTGREKSIEAEFLLPVTARVPNGQLYRDVQDLMAKGEVDGPKSLKRIGDCDAPSIIAASTFAGHRYARELDAALDRDNPLKHDRVFFQEG